MQESDESRFDGLSDRALACAAVTRVGPRAYDLLANAEEVFDRDHDTPDSIMMSLGLLEKLRDMTPTHEQGLLKTLNKRAASAAAPAAASTSSSASAPPPRPPPHQQLQTFTPVGLSLRGRPAGLPLGVPLGDEQPLHMHRPRPVPAHRPRPVPAQQPAAQKTPAQKMTAATRASPVKAGGVTIVG